MGAGLFDYNYELLSAIPSAFTSPDLIISGKCKKSKDVQTVVVVAADAFSHGLIPEPVNPFCSSLKIAAGLIAIGNGKSALGHGSNKSKRVKDRPVCGCPVNLVLASYCLKICTKEVHHSKRSRRLSQVFSEPLGVQSNVCLKPLHHIIALFSPIIAFKLFDKHLAIFD